MNKQDFEDKMNRTTDAIELALLKNHIDPDECLLILGHLANKARVQLQTNKGRTPTQKQMGTYIAKTMTRFPVLRLYLHEWYELKINGAL